ncbi:glycosyltransferase family 39 protein [Patescibacteria group bacterium]|nr:glycosyltransferase family 39 protein [Patescibacteria group bacterium]
MRERMFIGGLAVLFFVAYCWFGATSPQIFNSPDEAANYFFVERLAKNGDFFVSESLNHFLENRVHPRSISYNGVSLVPQGFIGLPLLYGWIARLFSLGIIKFITPLLAVFGALAFYGIIKKIFDKKIALLSFILLILFPVFWYYASRALYPNIPFVSLLLIASYAGITGALSKSGKKVQLLIFSFALGAALIFRPVEALWIVPIILALVFIYRKEISPMKVVYSILILGFLALPILANNYFLYGNILETGYTLNSAVDYSASQFNFIEIKNKILPYGLHPRAIWNNAYYFLIKYFWWYSIPAILGFLVWVFSKKTHVQKMYSLSALLSVGWLAVFYGSGTFADNPNIGRLTIGDSHFRYWLLIFILGIPFVAVFWQRISKRFKLLLPASIIFVAALSFYSVYFSLDDGLLSVKNNLEKNYKTKSGVLEIVRPEDVIITARQDKIFFPERRVLYAEKINDENLFSDIIRINDREFYYYTIGLHQEDLKNVNNFLRIYGLELERIKIFGKEVLYKLIRKNKSIVTLLHCYIV